MIKLRALLFLLLPLLFLGCETNECDFENDSDTFFLNSINVSDWPATRLDGSPWDEDGSGPDLTIALGSPTGVPVSFYGERTDAIPGQNVGIVLLDPDSYSRRTEYRITLFDVDVTPEGTTYETMGSYLGTLLPTCSSGLNIIQLISDEGLVRFNLRVSY